MLTPLLVIAALVVGLALGALLRRFSREPKVVEPVVRDPEPRQDPVMDVLNTLPDAIFVFDRSGKSLSRNTVAERLRSSGVGLLIEEVVERQVARAGDTPVEERHHFRAPSDRTVQVSSMRCADGRVVALVKDLSDQVRLEAMRSDFITNISHELKTPVGAIAVLAEAISEEADDATLRRVVQRMASEAERASQTLDNLLELSALEFAGIADPEDVDVGALVGAVVARFHDVTQPRSISVEVAAMPELVVRGSWIQLESALWNLVDNAVKYSADESVITISAEPNFGSVWLRIADNGCGIPQRELDRVFERFYRVDKSRGRGTGGTGLGLAIVRHVASNHGGTVKVESVEGDGSTFILELPLAPRTKSGEASGMAGASDV